MVVAPLTSGIAFPDLSHLGRVEAYVRRHRPATSFAALSNFESAPIVIGERAIGEYC